MILLRTALLLVILVSPAALAPCPRACSCPQPTEVHCTFRSLVIVPPAVPKHVKRMNLGFNRIYKMSEKSLAGLKNLELLLIHGNDIHNLPDRVFRDLQSLQMLKISYNKLKEVSRHTLQGLWSLARLHLDHNRLEFLHPDAFQGLTSLRLLQLEGNRLQQLHPATFATFTLMGHFQVSTLRHLYLSDNELRTLPSELLATIPQLENLYLHGNPWTCDCNMKWLHDWDKNLPGVLKCKKDKALPGGQVCPMCSSPRPLQKEELQSVANMLCSSPVISSPQRTSTPDDVESEVLATKDFSQPYGNISLGFSDEHGNEVDLECGLADHGESTKINWEQVNPLQLASNITLSVDIECPVDRGKYEKLWRLVAYYSNVPAHLERGAALSKEPHPAYVYRQDSEKDALYYTGVKVNIMAQPAWLMQKSVELQLNRLQSSAKTVKLILRTDFSEEVEVELAQRQRRTWVMIESKNTTRKVLSALLGSQAELNCNVHSSGHPAIQWMLPDGSRVEAPYSSPDNRVSASSEGQLVIKAVSHTDTGIYYCIAKVQGDLAVLPFHLTVLESSSPSPGEDVSPIQGFAGKPISLPCVTSGSPDAEVHWILPSSKIVSSHTNFSRTQVLLNGTLHIPQTQLSDSGHYKCIAINQHGVDTLVTKTTLIKQNGPIMPLKRFPARPQSASGINTQIKVPTEDNEEASGDVESAPVSRPDSPRRRMPGTAANKKGANPRKNQLGSRRKISVSKSKIDPEKWAHILAKIRDRKGQSTVTPTPVQGSTARMVTTTQFQKTAEESFKGVTGYETTPETSPQHTEVTSSASSSYTVFDTHGVTISTPPHATQTSYHVKHTSPERNLDLPATSNADFFLPRTTSVPPDVVTFWQANINTASGRSTDADGVDAADRGTTTERSERRDSGELSSNGNEASPSRSPHHPQIGGGQSGEYVGTTAATLQSQSQSRESSLEDLRSETTTVVPSTTVASTSVRPEGRPKQRGKNRKKRPNRRKQKLNKHTQFIATIPANVPQATVRTTSSSRLKIEPFTLETSTFDATVPFRSSHAASSGTVSLEQSSTEPSPPTSPTPSLPSVYEANSSVSPLAKPLLKGTSAAPSLPTVPPTVGRISSQTVLEYSEIPREDLEILTSNPVWSFTGSTSSTVKPLGGIPSESLTEEPELHPVATDVQTQTEPQHMSTEGNIFNDTDVPYSPPPQSPSSGFLSEHELTTTTKYISRGLITMLGMQFEASGDITEVTTVEPTVELWNHSSSPPNATISEGGGHQETTNVRDQITHPYVTTDLSDFFPSTVAPYVTPSKSPSLGATEKPSFDTTDEQPNSQDQQIQASTTSEPRGTSEFYLTTQTSDHRLLPNSTAPAAKQITTQTVTPTTGPFTEGQLASTREVSGKHRQPGQGSIPRGKPRITKSNFQTFTVKAETDVELPCEADGEPKPFLSWTKVASGVVIAQNTRVQRFEVKPNGSLIIRNTQPVDEGEYQCTVLNQHGTDTMVANVVILSQPPLILQPRQRDVTVNLGGKVHLDCAVEGHPTPRVTWVLPNRVHVAPLPHGAPSQQRVSVLSNGTLHVREAADSDGGTYKCVGSSTAGSDAVLVRVHVSGIPPVAQQENITLAEGGDAYIHCNASAALQPLIRWITPDGTQLTTSQFGAGQKLVVFPNGTLHIRGLGMRNIGRYECLASNALGSSRRVVVLSLKRSLSSAKARIVSSSPQRTEVIYGERLLLDCVATGDPAPRIIWRTPSKKLVDTQYSFDSRIRVLTNGTIAIHSVTEKDSGDYLCVARNKIGDDYVLLRVNVMTRPAKIKQKPQHTSQEVIYGGDLKVDCVASGLPNPEISWALPDGTMVNPVKTRDSSSGGRSRRYVVFDNGTLYFNEVGMPEEGDYTCYAENKLGKDEMKVTVKVKAAIHPPKIQDKKQYLVKGFYGESVVLTCNAKGDPLPLITWISPTNRVIVPASDKYKVLNDGTLIIQKVQRFDGGNYSCIARNNAGQDFKVTRLEVLVTSPVINGLSGHSNTISVTAVQDQKKFLDCSAKGTPTPRVMWLLPGNVVLPAPYNSKRMTVHQNGTLEIRSLKKTDSGKLSCIARNEGGEVRLLVNLNVHDAAEWSHNRDPKAESMSLSVGNSVTLNCSSEGAHLPRVTWILPNGTPLNSGARLSKFFHRPDGSLIISNPSVSEAGMYRCLGRDFQGLVERVIMLSPGRKPEITNRYNSPVNTMIGETMLLHCLTNTEPVRLTWTLPSGVLLNRPQKAGRYNVLSNGTLAIHSVSAYDRGSYLCRVANEYGSSLLSASVTVMAYPPQITSSLPSVTHAKRGVAIQLNCIATGFPTVELAWETPDKSRLVIGAQPRLLGNKYLHPQGSLIIQNPTQRDTGMYRCTARNAIGMDSKSTFLKVF